MSYFPADKYDDAGAYAQAYFSRLSSVASTLDFGALSAAGQLLGERARKGATIYSCGNGGSAAIANHLVCDCLKGVRANTDLKPRVQSLSTNIELITAIVNDIGVEEVFEYQLSSLGLAGDVLIAISSSGTSPNVVRVIKTAKVMGLATIAMTGFTGGPSAKLADISLHVSAKNYGLIEDTHQSMMHILAQFMRQSQLTSPELLGSLKF